MTIYRVCQRHRKIIRQGHPCPQCQAARDQRRSERNTTLGRTSPHWRKLSARIITTHRKTHGATCPECHRPETTDPSTKLTVDLIRGGDHTTATEHECRVLCRRCHGHAQGSRHRGEGYPRERLGLDNPRATASRNTLS